MTLKTLSRRVQDFTGFVIKSVRIVGSGEQTRIEARLEPDPRVKRRCSCCGKPGRVHDTLRERRWDFVPLWGIPVTLYYAARRVVCPERGGPTVELRAGFAELEEQRPGFLNGLRVICSDTWKPYLKVIAEKAGSALNVLDPFHVAQHLNTAVDTVRRGEQSRLKGKQARTRVKGSRFLLLKRGTRVRGKAREKLQNVLAALKATSRAWELKESFRKFWSYRSTTWAAAYLKAWTSRAMRSRLELRRSPLGANRKPRCSSTRNRTVSFRHLDYQRV